MSKNGNWKGKLQGIIDEHNHRHAKAPRDVGFKTRAIRASALFVIFNCLRLIGYTPDPDKIRGKHVERLVWYWTCDPRIEQWCRDRGVPMLPKAYSPKYLQSLASTLRVFCGWIGKPGMVLPLQRYVADPARVVCSNVAKQDKGWEGRGIDIAQVLLRVALIDERVAIMLELQWVLGLRRMEVVMLQPHIAVIPAGLLPIDAPIAQAYLACLEVERGTKGGRLRLVPIISDRQREAIERARRYAEFPCSHLGHPGKSLLQALDKYKNVMSKAGITKKGLGVTGHGLRHQFAGDQYFDLAKVPCAIRGGDAMADPELLERVLLAVSRQLGHNRTQITSAYLGSHSQSRAETPTADARRTEALDAP